jgi:D-alanyl-D-alanine carboxypeptidase
VQQVGDWVGHDGITLGYGTEVYHLPTAGATVVVMVNAAGPESVPAEDLWRGIVELLYPDSLPQWPN